MPTVFIHYRRDDEEAARLIELLRLRLPEVNWFIDDSIYSGATWKRRILEALDDCQAALMLFTPRYIQDFSDPTHFWLPFEAFTLDNRYRREASLFLIPVCWPQVSLTELDRCLPDFRQTYQLGRPDDVEVLVERIRQVPPAPASLLYTHDEYLTTLHHFAANLREDVLPFVLPPSDAEFHPDRLVNRLLAGRHPLLTGAGGVGKTRTCLEVAIRLTARGWSVLHSRSSTEAPGIPELRRAVVRSGKPTLIIFDYLDQLLTLEADALQSLISQCQQRGQALRLLACRRPGRAEEGDERLLALFQEVLLTPDVAQQQEIRRAAVMQVAPTAVHRWGYEPVADLCGERPILTVFIAREVERCARAAEPFPMQLRQGELLVWLRRRLKETGIEPPAKKAPLLRPAAPEPEVLAAAAVLGRAPEHREALVAAAAATLGGPENAAFLVDRLVEAGWLEPRDSLLVSAHDVVTDEVLDQVLLREQEMSRVMAGGTGDARALFALAIALKRMCTGLSPQRQAAIGGMVAAWLDREGVGIGALLGRIHRGLAAAALGALLSGVPWVEPVLARWEDVVGPYLRESGLETWSLLHRGLRGGRADARLLPLAADWLAAWYHRWEAGAVVRELLERPSLPRDLLPTLRGWAQRHGLRAESDRILRMGLWHPQQQDHREFWGDLAQGWLEVHAGTDTADFVLRHLLPLRPGLAGLADEWLQGREGQLDSQFLLHTLLKLPLGEWESSILERSRRWLAEHGKAAEAAFVLGPLLERKLDVEVGEQAEGAALVWLAEHGKAAEAQFVLRPLLERKLGVEDEKQAEGAALVWLAEHGKAAAAGFMLRPLLERKLGVEAEKQAEGAALAWLAEHGTAVEAGFVLRPLLERKLGVEVGEQTEGAALVWLAEHGKAAEAQFVLGPLLKRKLDVEVGEQAEGAALLWLGEHGKAMDAQFVLHPLLKRKLGVEAEKQAEGAALVWLAEHGKAAEAGFVLRPLLERKLDVEAEKQAEGAALLWLGEHGTAAEAGFVLHPLLKRKLSPEVAAKVEDAALSWLAAHGRRLDADWVLQRLVVRELPGRALELAAVAETWLGCHAGHYHSDRVFNRMLRREDISDTNWQFFAEAAVYWLRQHPNHPERSWVFSSLLTRPGLLRPILMPYRRLLLRDINRGIPGPTGVISSWSDMILSLLMPDELGEEE